MAKEFQGEDVSIPELGILATLEQRVDRGPMRTASDVSQKRAVGWYASQKNGRGQFWESRNELHAFHVAEVSPRVVRYRAQPHTLRVVIAGKKWSYTPDREDTLSDRRIEIVEVKQAYEREKDMAYDAKLDIARKIYEHRGWSFCILEREEIEAKPRFPAVQYIQRFRRTVLTPDDEDRVLNCFRGLEALPVSTVRGLWQNPELGFAKMCALMVKRTIDIEIEKGLSEATLVRRVSA